MSILPSHFAESACVFAHCRAWHVEQELTPVCGSPIEVYFACCFVVQIEGMRSTIDIVYSDEAAAAAQDFFIYPQKQLAQHRVDFLIGRRDGSKIVVECDGRDFHHAQREQIERDRKRDAELTAMGYRVLRYPGTQIHKDEWYVVMDALAELAPQFLKDWVNTNAVFLRSGGKK